MTANFNSGLLSVLFTAGKTRRKAGLHAPAPRKDAAAIGGPATPHTLPFNKQILTSGQSFKGEVTRRLTLRLFGYGSATCAPRYKVRGTFPKPKLACDAGATAGSRRSARPPSRRPPGRAPLSATRLQAAQTWGAAPGPAPEAEARRGHLRAPHAEASTAKLGTRRELGLPDRTASDQATPRRLRTGRPNFPAAGRSPRPASGGRGSTGRAGRAKFGSATKARRPARPAGRERGLPRPGPGRAPGRGRSPDWPPRRAPPRPPRCLPRARAPELGPAPAAACGRPNRRERSGGPAARSLPAPR